MKSKRTEPTSIDEYISTFAPHVQETLERIWQTIRSAAPEAQEGISYGMPAFTLNGALVYFAAWKHHIGFYPPVAGDPRLDKALGPYRGEKGNLQFPLDRPIPFDLIERIGKFESNRTWIRSRRDEKEGNSKWI
jgi:uncharacterized protein YdhG (YjbR/CyaY superfamily)